jgi:Chalcone isomerase-like
MTRTATVAIAPLRIGTILLILISAVSTVAAQPGRPRPLPPPVVSQAPGIHPLGKGRHSWWGIQMYDATLWIVGPRYSAAAPHALDIEPGRAVSSDTLIKNAISEMRDLKVGDESKLRAWQAEMTKVIPNLRQGDQVVIFCADGNRTLVYLNDSSIGAVDDQTFCPAVMSVWLHPRTKYGALRNSLLGH